VSHDEVPAAVVVAVEAARDKKASELKVLDLRGLEAFTDYFVVVSGTNVRQVKAIVDAILDRLSGAGMKVHHVEGLALGEWVLIDGSDFVVHVFTPDKRALYDLERLWGDAAEVDIPEAAA